MYHTLYIGVAYVSRMPCFMMHYCHNNVFEIEGKSNFEISPTLGNLMDDDIGVSFVPSNIKRKFMFLLFHKQI